MATGKKSKPIRVAIITPTIGRPSLSRTIGSAIDQMLPTDEWWIVGDGPQPKARQIVKSFADDRLRYSEIHVPGSRYGNEQRNWAMQQSKADYFVFLDDDDCFLPGALDAIRREGVSGRPLMFRMDYRPRSCILWEQPELRIGNVSATMFVLPNRPGKRGTWSSSGDATVSDFNFMQQTLAFWPKNSLRWCRDIIYRCERHGAGHVEKTAADKSTDNDSITDSMRSDKGKPEMPLEQPTSFIQRKWLRSKFPFSNESDRLFNTDPTIGVVVGTFAGVPFIHLQLEAHRRLYPHIPILIHDDASHRGQSLKKLCAEYGADFETNSERLGHQLGDLSSVVGGLKWAEHRKIDLLVKLSRRWIFLVDWASNLRKLALMSQYATYSNYTISWDYGFRTECVGFAVRLWGTPRFYRPAIEEIRCRRDVFMEGYIHRFAIELEQVNCTQADQWKQRQGMPNNRCGYAQWPLMGTCRDNAAASAKYLWHNSHPPKKYAQLARKWGLPYSETDFVDPNQ